MDIALIILGALLLVLGIIGCIVPALPGVPLAKTTKEAIRSGWGSFIGLLAGTTIKLISCGLMVYYFIAEIVR